MSKFIKTFPLGSAIILAVLSCADQSPQSKSLRSVEKYISDSLTNQKINFLEASRFDTITKFDSLQSKLNFIENQINYGTQQLDQALLRKESFEDLASITSMFTNEENKKSVEVNKQNINTTINNLQIGLENYEVSKNAIKEKLKDENLKNQILGYSLTVNYSTGRDTVRQSFILSNSFIVKK